MLHALPMQNRRFHIVLLAGGPRDLAREIRDKLAKARSIFVKYHREYDKEHQWSKPIPKDVDFVIMLKDMMSHPMFDKMRRACSDAGLRWVVTQRKMSTMIAALNNYGIRSSEGIPVNIASVAYFNDSEPAVESAPAKPIELAPIVGAVKVEPPPSLDHKPHTVSIFVTQTPIPEGMPLTPRPGSPRPETMVLIAALQQMAQDDHVNIMITPTSITVEPVK